MPTVWRYVAAGLLGAVAFSMVIPFGVATLVASGAGHSTAGVFALLPYSVLLVSLPFRAVWLRQLGVRQASFIGASFGFVAACLFIASDRLEFWLPGSVLAGLYLTLSWGVTDDLIARFSAPHEAGRTAGLYQSLVGAALMMGPFAPFAFNLDWQEASGAAAVLFIGAVGVLLTVRDISAPEVNASTQPVAWRLLGAALVGGVFETGLATVAPMISVGRAAEPALAATVAAAVAAGSVVAQWPIGLMGDRWSPAKLIWFSGLVLLLSCPLLVAVDLWPPAIWMLSAVWGALGGGLYTLVLAELARRRHVENCFDVSSVIAAYTLGAVLTPALGAYTLERVGLLGLAVGLGVLAAVITAIFLRGRDDKGL